MNRAAHPVRVLLADDHPLLLKGLRDIVASDTRFDVVATAADGDTALALIRAFRPEIAVLDLAMPQLSGLDLLRRIGEEADRTRVVLLTALISDNQVLEALTLGVWGILLKESAPEALVDCLHAVADGRRQLPPDIVERAMARRTRSTQRDRLLEETLTTREREIVALVCEGRPNTEVATMLGLSAGTVRIHLHNIYTKLNVRNRTALTALVLNETPS